MPENDPAMEELDRKKLSLEIDNLAQQQEKTSLEIERLRRAWYRDAEYVIKALAIPLTVIAIALTFITQNVQNDLRDANEKLATAGKSLDTANRNLADVSEELNGKRTEIATLQKELNAKKVEVEGLASERDELVAQSRNLASANREVEKTNNILKLETEKMRSDRDHLRESVSELRKKQEMLEYEFHLDLISSDKPDLAPPWFRNPSNEEMVRLLKRDVRNRNAYVDATERRIKDSRDWRVRTVLLHNLYLGTNEETWKRRLKSELLEDPELNLERSLADIQSLASAIWAPIWEDRERVQLCLSILKRARERRSPWLFSVVFVGNWQLELTEVMKPNTDETLMGLVLDGIAVGRDVARDEGNSWALRRRFLDDLCRISTDACLAVLGTILSDPTTRDETRLGVREFLRDGPALPKWSTEIDPEAERGGGALSRENVDPLWWQNWKKENQEWVDLFIEPSLKTLRQRILEQKHRGVR